MIWNAAAVALTAVVMLMGMQLGVRRALLHEMDAFLLEELDQYASILRVEPIASLGPGQQSAARNAPPARFVEVIDPQNRALWIRLGGHPPADDPGPLKERTPTSVGDFRIVQRHLEGVDGKTLLLRVGLPLEVINQDVARADALALVAAAGVLIAAPLLGYWLAGRVTTVLRDFNYHAARLRPARLDQRLPVRGTGDELDHLAVTVNGFVDRMASYLSRREDFVANAAHELRTPVAAIRTTAEVALSGQRTQEEYNEFLEDVIDECASLDALVGQLLLLSESEANRLQIHGDRVALHAVVAQSAQMFGDVAQSLDIRLQSRIDEAVVEGNRHHLRQVVNNLLDNALKFTPAGGRIDVALSIDADHRTVRLTVANSGAGISPEDLPHIFERFYRGDKSRSRGPGSGLGLSICQAVVEAHNGRLEVASNPGQGACFTVTLPQAPMSGDSAVEALSRESPAANSAMT